MMRYQWTNEVVIWLFFLCIMHYLTPQTSSWQWLEIFYIAYFLVHSLANSWYLDLSVLYSLKRKDKILIDVWWMYKYVHLAISGTRGSSGLGSQSKEQIESSTFEMVSAGDHWDLACDVTWIKIEAVRPLISPENVETDWSVGVDVGMIDLSSEGDLWWLKRVVWNEYILLLHYSLNRNH